MTMVNAVRSFWQTINMRSSTVHRLRSHRYFPLAMVAVALLLISCLHIWQRVTVLDLVHEVSKLENEQEMLLDNTKKMYGHVAELSMSHRIRQYAVDTLGMQPVSMDQLYTVERDEPTLSDPDDLAMMITAIKRVVSQLPTIAQENVSAAELQQVKIDSSVYPRGGR